MPPAFGQLYERYRDPVFRYCLSRTGAKHEAEGDLVADVFIRRDGKGSTGTIDRGLPFHVFLFRIARNAATDRSRKTRPDTSIDEQVNHPESNKNVEAEAVRSIERDTLFNAMSKAEVRLPRSAPPAFCRGVQCRGCGTHDRVPA